MFSDQSNSFTSFAEGAGARECMGETAIRVSNLSKCYQIYESPRDRLKQFVAPFLQRLVGQQPKQYFREFWALKNVSFEVKKGDTFGIIGRNGSGKSTLLQMICGTLSPTGGEVRVNGRVAALLELGAGFNPEFTGRENVYMNAALFGLSTAEIDGRYDEIVKFSELSEFIDQPVKTYSNGMFVRLAFSVAVSVNADILVVDEALSVGDIAFRNKCLLKIRALSECGVTVLFVTHDISTLQLICDRVLWLDSGECRAAGNPASVCQEYYVAMVGSNFQASAEVIAQHETELARFASIQLFSSALAGGHRYSYGENLELRFSLQALTDLPSTIFAVSIYRADGDWLVGQTSRESGRIWPSAGAGQVLHGSFTLTGICLAAGEYKVALAAYSPDHSICYALTDFVINFSVRTDFHTWGKFIHPCRWEILDGAQSPSTRPLGS